MIFGRLREPSRFSGGGGSSGIFPWSPNADAIQWGGGVVAEFLPDLRKPARFQWGRGSTIHFPLMGPFYIFGIFKRGDPLLHFCDFQKEGARAPRAPRPPPESATEINLPFCLCVIRTSRIHRLSVLLSWFDWLSVVFITTYMYVL